ncbi:MAG TPA: DUF4159 domain-containing protein [Bacteroidales bacterium]|nr:DUF4159 domain-containing protein [Bacteroidales bacterium]
MKKLIFILFLFFTTIISGQESSYKIALLKYNGGGDWYANPTSLTNLIQFANEKIHTNIDKEYATVAVGSSELFNYPFVHITGHGNILFSESEAANLRKYLEGGGFLEISDNYGLDKYIRREMKKVFPDLNFVELPSSHPIFHTPFNFPNGLPKIHEHDGKPAQGFAIFFQGRMVVFYDYECDLGDGWEDPEVHHDSEETRLKALKMGSNILYHIFMK